MSRPSKYHSFRGTEVWKYLCRHPHSRVKDICKALGWKARDVSSSLWVLARQGSAKHEGHATLSKWCATEYEPIDGRGLTQGSAIGRALGGSPDSIIKATKALAAKRAATGKVIVPKVQFRPATAGKIALEQCWPIARISTNTKRIEIATILVSPFTGASCVGTPEDKEAA